MDKTLEYYLKNNLIKNREDKIIAEKVYHGQRISPREGFYLYTKTETALLSVLANHVRHKINASTVYYIRNIHLEPTNICIYNCKFCSFSQKTAEGGSWFYTLEQIENIVENIDDNINEIHITGGTHPDSSLKEYVEIIKLIRNKKPNIHIKAFSAAELFYVFNKDAVTYEEGLKILVDAGLNSIPGGGAEIFDEGIRKKICAKKVTSSEWLEIHKTAHKIGIFSNATMLYGHIENYNHRIDHINRLRELQDETHMFNAFIPLKFKNRNNEMSNIKEVTFIEDLRNYAVARIFLDNIPHLKAYWPMLGKNQAQLSLSFGVDDIDGTIGNSTDIYTSAGVEESDNAMSVDELNQIIKQAGYIPVERYSDYSAVNV